MKTDKAPDQPKEEIAATPDPEPPKPTPEDGQEATSAPDPIPEPPPKPEKNFRQGTWVSWKSWISVTAT